MLIVVLAKARTTTTVATRTVRRGACDVYRMNRSVPPLSAAANSWPIGRPPTMATVTMVARIRTRASPYSSGCWNWPRAAVTRCRALEVVIGASYGREAGRGVLWRLRQVAIRHDDAVVRLLSECG